MDDEPFSFSMSWSSNLVSKKERQQVRNAASHVFQGGNRFCVESLQLCMLLFQGHTGAVGRWGNCPRAALMPSKKAALLLTQTCLKSSWWRGRCMPTENRPAPCSTGGFPPPASPNRATPLPAIPGTWSPYSRRCSAKPTWWAESTCSRASAYDGGQEEARKSESRRRGA